MHRPALRPLNTPMELGSCADGAMRRTRLHRSHLRFAQVHPRRVQLPDAPVFVIATVFGVAQERFATRLAGPDLAAVAGMEMQGDRRFGRPLVHAGWAMFLQRRLLVAGQPQRTQQLQGLVADCAGKRVPAGAGEGRTGGAGVAPLAPGEVEHILCLQSVRSGHHESGWKGNGGTAVSTYPMTLKALRPARDSDRVHRGKSGFSHLFAEVPFCHCPRPIPASPCTPEKSNTGGSNATTACGTSKASCSTPNPMPSKSRARASGHPTNPSTTCTSASRWTTTW